MDIDIKKIYDVNDGVMLNYILPTVIIIIFLFIILWLFIKVELSSSKTEWAINKCNPKYMFVSGFIQKEPGYGAIGSTYKNFKNCVQDILKQ